MSTNTIPSASAARGLGTGTWRLDPARSSVEFHVRHFYGLMTVKGRFDRYHGSLDLSARPAVELTIDADSLNTKLKKRDEHLRTDDFFDVANHPHVRFVSDNATHQGDTLEVSGRLHAVHALGLGLDPARIQASARGTSRRAGGIRVRKNRRALAGRQHSGHRRAL